MLLTYTCKPYHARAGKRVPAEPDAIFVLNVAPLVLQRLVVGHGGWYWVCLGSACGRWWDQAAPTIRIRGAGVEVWRRSQGGIRRPKNRSFGHSLGISRLQRVREVATCPQRQPTDRVDSVNRAHAARLRFGSSHPQTGLAPGPSSDVDQNSEFSLCPLLFSRQNAGIQTLLTAVSCLNHESVFALSVEKTRPMAGRPVWR